MPQNPLRAMGVGTNPTLGTSHFNYVVLFPG